MDHHAREYFCSYSQNLSHGRFHDVVELNERPLVEWPEAKKLAPLLSKGWYELAQLPVQDRIEFTKEYWLVKLPYHPKLSEFLTHFFAGIDDIGIFLTQKSYDDLYEAHLVYSLAGNGGFFHGSAPASEQEIIDLQKDFPEYILPPDYMAFLRIHNGFAKLEDTGIYQSKNVLDAYANLQNILEKNAPMMTAEGVIVNPRSLIPFYQSFGMSFYQCFWGEWYPDQEMGNVYYSSATGTISEYLKTMDSIETMAFTNFEEWLMFYLEKID
ncbi:MAG: SMI1/KNR4 family protein [Parachlamydia sp.]|jgi:hypothetical protein|nr:SMI1/KNR4 family protein [Parachlamydia sp.]